MKSLAPPSEIFTGELSGTRSGMTSTRSIWAASMLEPVIEDTIERTFLRLNRLLLLSIAPVAQNAFLRAPGYSDQVQKIAVSGFWHVSNPAAIANDLRR